MSSTGGCSGAVSLAQMEQALAPVFERMEGQRRQAIWAFWRSLFIALLCLPLCLLPLLLFRPHDEGVVALTLAQSLGQALALSPQAVSNLGMVLCLLIGLFVVVALVLLARYFVRNGRQPGWDYADSYKAQVFAQVCELRYPSLRFHPHKGIPWKVLDESQLFAWVSDEYRSNDYFEGRIGQTDVRFAEATAKRERKRLHKGRLQTYLQTYFTGLVFEADFHKHFHSTTRIVPADEKVVKVRGQSRVTLEDPNFERLFVATSTDQVDARYVLSTSMVARIVDLHARCPGLRILLKHERMLLVLPSVRDRFEPRLYRKARCSRQIAEFVADVDAILAIVDALNLNTRIWSKL